MSGIYVRISNRLGESWPTTHDYEVMDKVPTSESPSDLVGEILLHVAPHPHFVRNLSLLGLDIFAPRKMAHTNSYMGFI